MQERPVALRFLLSNTVCELCQRDEFEISKVETRRHSLATEEVSAFGLVDKSATLVGPTARDHHLHDVSLGWIGAKHEVLNGTICIDQCVMEGVSALVVVNMRAHVETHPQVVALVIT